MHILLRPSAIQIFNGRKTDKCGVILFGSEETNNIVNDASGGYEHVSEYIPIAQPNSATLAKLAALEPSTVCGDRMCTPSMYMPNLTIVCSYRCSHCCY